MDTSQLSAHFFFSTLGREICLLYCTLHICYMIEKKKIESLKHVYTFYNIMDINVALDVYTLS